MSLTNGLYKVEFSTALGSGAGIVTITSGKIQGGDSRMFYIGEYSVGTDGSFSAVVRVATHSKAAGMWSVIGMDNGTLKLTGRASAEIVAATAVLVENQSIQMETNLTRLTD